MPSADNLCKQFGPRSGPTKCRACSGLKLFYTRMVFLKEFFEKVDFEKISREQINMKNYPVMIYKIQQIKCCVTDAFCLFWYDFSSTVNSV